MVVVPLIRVRARTAVSRAGSDDQMETPAARWK
jgi:hypothetical protein